MRIGDVLVLRGAATLPPVAKDHRLPHRSPAERGCDRPAPRRHSSAHYAEAHPLLPGGRGVLPAEARTTVDAAARDELVRQAQLALLADAPYTMLIQPVFSYPYRTSITGLVPNPTWNFDPSTIARV